MKAPFSAYLNSLRGGLNELIALLRQTYEYVSVLATDSCGLTVSISQRSRAVGSETMTTERGIVVRVCREGLYSEYALNTFDPADPAAAAEEIRAAFARQKALLEATGTAVYETPVLSRSRSLSRRRRRSCRRPRTSARWSSA